MNRFGPAIAAPKPRKNDLQATFLEAQELHNRGRLDEAQPLYRQVLKKRPDHFDTLHRLGVLEHQRGNPETAIQFIKRALMVNRKDAHAHSNLATVLLSVKRYEEALAHADKALAQQPHFAAAHYNRGTALNELQRYAEAIEALDAALLHEPNHADSLNNKGSSLHELGRYDEAIAIYDRVLALAPLHGIALANKATSLKGQRRMDDSLAHYDRALTLLPNFDKAWNDRGDVLFVLGRYEEAMASYRKALAIDTENVEAWLGCANILLMWRKADEAQAACNQALRVAPSSSRALIQLGQFHAMKGQADEAVACFDRALEVKSNAYTAISSKIFFLDFSETADVARQQEARSVWWEKLGARIYDHYGAPHDNTRDPDRKLVVGYVSGDFNARSPAYSFRPVLEHHDKARVEVICYSTTVLEDEITDSFRRVTDHWRNVTQWTDDELADGIRADKVDILIDLSGHTEGNRLHIFARKPAPIQVTAWGFGSGTGLKTMDYLFADPVALPVEDRHLYAEQIWDLPSRMIMEPPPAELHCSEPPVCANGYMTYGMFNRVSKVSDTAIALWARILQADPTARLMFKDYTVDDPAVLRSLIERFGSHGIDRERLSFLGATSREDHLKAFGQVDVCLDPFPQNGGISTWEALYMGVPVVTKLGTTVASRCTAAIVAAIGMTDWIAKDEAQYVEIARAAGRERLTSLRNALPGMITKHCGPAAYTRAVEDAYRTMWSRYCHTAAS